MDEGKERELKEEWKVIENYPDYSISNLGRVKSLKFNKERILKQVYKLILEVFNHVNISSDSKMYCKDKNNSINNLEWIK